MPLVLAINTATPTKTIALIKDNSLIDEVSWDQPMSESDMVLPTIDALLKKHSLSRTELTQILVVHGPGSFTGLRIGVTIANTIAYALQISIGSISSLAFLRARSASPVDMVFFETAPNLLFIEDITSLRRVTIAEIPSQGIVATGVVSEGTQVLLPQVHWVPTNSLVSPGKAMETLLPLVIWSKKSIQPVYMREPGITVSKHESRA